MRQKGDDMILWGAFVIYVVVISQGDSVGSLQVADNVFSATCTRDRQLLTDPDTERGERNVVRDLASSGWYMESVYNLSGPCTIDKFELIELSQSSFQSRYYDPSLPVVVHLGNTQKAMSEITKKSTLLQMYGNHTVTLATANTHSYRKVDMMFSRYIADYVRPQLLDVKGKDTLYLFGDNDRVAWKDLFNSYILPPYSLPNMHPELSFGIAGPGSGVPFHIHGPTFAETIYGRKRWFLYPPSSKPDFDPDTTTLQWYLHKYPHLSSPDSPYECTLYPGEVLFIPSMWWHATLNVDTTVFMSTFFSGNYVQHA